MAYSYYRSVTIDYTKCGTANSTDFPVLVSFTDASFKWVLAGGKIQSGAGYDINFYSDIGLTTALYYQVERWISSTGECIFWVKVPTLSSTANTVIYVAYGDASITTPQSSSINVWNSNFEAVYHLTNGTTLSAQDSTLYGRNGTITGALATTGKIDGGASFAGGVSTDNILTTLTTVPSQRTISAWVYIAGPGGGGLGRFVARGTEGFYQNYASSLLSFTYPFTTTALTATAPNSLFNTWIHVAVTYDNSNTSNRPLIYLNGVSQTITIITAPVGTPNSSFAFVIGNSSAGVRALQGNIDEVRFTNNLLSSSWILSEYNNQNSPSTFFTLGAETSTTSTSNFFQMFY